MRKKILVCAISILIGSINGFFGAGGGMLCVPLLEKLLNKPAKKAHATAILVILPISLASAIIYIINGYFEMGNGIVVCAAVVGGGLLGGFLLNKLTNTVIEVVFSIVMIGAGIKMLF